MVSMGSRGCWLTDGRVGEKEIDPDNDPEQLCGAAVPWAKSRSAKPKPMTLGGSLTAGSASRIWSICQGGVYRCPAGEKLTYKYTKEEDGKAPASLVDDGMLELPSRRAARHGSERRITRWEHEQVLEV